MDQFKQLMKSQNKEEICLKQFGKSVKNKFWI